MEGDWQSKSDWKSKNLRIGSGDNIKAVGIEGVNVQMPRAQHLAIAYGSCFFMAPPDGSSCYFW